MERVWPDLAAAAAVAAAAAAAAAVAAAEAAGAEVGRVRVGQGGGVVVLNRFFCKKNMCEKM